MLIFRKNSKAELLLRFDRRTSCTFRNLTAADKTQGVNFTRVETTSVLVAPTATAIWRKRGATEQNAGQHTPENATESTMTTS